MQGMNNNKKLYLNVFYVHVTVLLRNKISL